MARLTTREWRCGQCGTRLAWFDNSGLHLHPSLRRLDGKVDGMPRWGLKRGPDPAPGESPADTRRLPLVAYCPACGARKVVAP